MHAGIRQYARQLTARRMRKRHVSNDSFSKKSGHAVLRAVEKLVWDEKFSRTQVLLERTDRAYGDDALHAQELHCVDVGAVINLARQNSVPAAVPRPKRDALAFQRAKHDCLLRIADWRSHAN